VQELVGDFNFDYNFADENGNEAFREFMQDGIWKWVKPGSVKGTQLFICGREQVVGPENQLGKGLGSPSYIRKELRPLYSSAPPAISDRSFSNSAICFFSREISWSIASTFRSSNGVSMAARFASVLLIR
jgi:hypothetical protein